MSLVDLKQHIVDLINSAKDTFGIPLSLEYDAEVETFIIRADIEIVEDSLVRMIERLNDTYFPYTFILTDTKVTTDQTSDLVVYVPFSDVDSPNEILIKF